MLSELLAAVEAAAVRGWPALSTKAHAGWLCRHTSGGSVRANSVATLSFIGQDVEAAISAVERFYAQRHATALFTICDVTKPADLDARLAARGYRRGDDHVTMVKSVDPAAGAPSSVAAASAPDPDWLSVYLSGLSMDRRPIAPRLLAHLCESSANVPTFITAHADGQPISSGLTIVDGPLASVQCMASLPTARRRGGARAVLAAIEAHAAAHGATHLHLQTSADNAAARALYTAFGFDVLGRYWTRTAPQAPETPR